MKNKEYLLRETTVALGFACRLMEQMQEFWRNGAPVHPGSELANDTNAFLKRVMEGPRFTEHSPNK